MRRVLAALVWIALTLALAELGTRLWLGYLAPAKKVMLYGDTEAVESLPNPLYTRHHYLPFIPTPGYREGANRHNSLGFRGDEIETPKPEGVLRIALLGGSTTYTTAVKDVELSYPAQLEKRLREMGYEAVEVINAGCGRYSTWESLLNLQFRVLDLEPDLVIVYHGVNDVHPRVVYPPEAYRGDNSASRQPYVRPETRGWDRSAVLRVIRTELGLRDPMEGLLYLRTFDYLPENYSRQHDRQRDSGTYPQGIFVEHPIEEMLEANDPRYFRRNLENIVAISRVQRAVPVLMTFAWSNDYSQPEARHANSEPFQRAYAEQNEVIRDICRELEVACFDFAEVMPKRSELWHDGRHVTEAGARLKAELVAGFLAGAGVLEEAAGEAQAGEDQAGEDRSVSPDPAAPASDR